MNDTKPWWQSKGILGSFAVLISVALSAFGFEIDTLEGFEEGLTETLVTLTTLVGGVLALIGRVKATKKVD